MTVVIVAIGKDRATTAIKYSAAQQLEACLVQAFSWAGPVELPKRITRNKKKSAGFISLRTLFHCRFGGNGRARFLRHAWNDRLKQPSEKHGLPHDAG